MKKNRRNILKGAGLISALTVWHKPIVNNVVLPAHAQTSTPPPPPEELCSAIVVDNVIFGPVSGNNTPPVCTVTFDILSNNSRGDLTIISIQEDALPANTTITVQDLGPATSTTGPRVTWRGPASDAPFCTNPVPVDDVVFTVTATCQAADEREFSQDFLLSEILG